MTQPLLRRAVIPVAGYGTRLFPATKAIRKEFFPVVGPDDIARPAILLIVEEALSAGVEEVILIVQQNDLDGFRAFFTEPVSQDYYARLPVHLQDCADHILEIGQQIRFAVQPSPEGTGHAVYCAREATGNEPFLLMWGDRLYRSTSDVSCAWQLADAYHQHGMNIVGLTFCHEDDLASRGIAGGHWCEKERLLEATTFAEKPSPHYAREYLHVPGLPDTTYLAFSGQYILQPGIFEVLERLIREDIREHGEIQLTTALEALRREAGCLGLIVQGQTYDIGQPGCYLDTLEAFRQSDDMPFSP